MTQFGHRHVEYHVVCLIDVLGQKPKLEKWANLPEDGKPTPRLMEAMEQTVGTVLNFRDFFEGLFEEAAKSTIAETIKTLPEDQQATYQRFRDCGLKTQQFSDTFVFYSPISNSHGDISVISLHRILSVCCSAMLLSLARETPIRGAICVGAGVELEDRNFYGPALAEAHHLESEVAELPRVLVSDAVRQLLSLSQPYAYSAHGDTSNLMQDMAGACQKFLGLDNDGRTIVDFMGKGIHKHLGRSPTFLHAAQAAYDFVRSEARRFRQKGDEKHASRYEWLLQYIESRLPIWGLKREYE